MVRRLFSMLGFLSFFGVSFADKNPGLFQRIGNANRQEQNIQKPVAAPVAPAVESAGGPGMIQSVLCAPIVLPAAIARFVQNSLTVSEEKDTSPWFWQTWNKPAAVDVATYSMVPWYVHAGHGYYQRLQCLQNDELKEYSTMWQRVKALDFATFDKMHPIQSMKGSKRVMWPLVGPMIAAHATGLAYHAVVEHTPRKWYSKKVTGTQK